jgi:hypothetical protein
MFGKQGGIQYDTTRQRFPLVLEILELRRAPFQGKCRVAITSEHKKIIEVDTKLLQAEDFNAHWSAYALSPEPNDNGARGYLLFFSGTSSATNARAQKTHLPAPLHPTRRSRYLRDFRAGNSPMRWKL